MSADSVEALGRLVEEFQYRSDPSELMDRVSPAELRAYLRAKAEQETDHDCALQFALPFVLRFFPVDWWAETVADLVESGSDTQGADALVTALYEVDPTFFARAPHHLVRWSLSVPEVMAVLTDHRERALEGLRAMLQQASGSDRWSAAGFLLLLEPESEPLVEAAVRSLGVAEAGVAHWNLGRFGFELRDGSLRRLWPSTVYDVRFEPAAAELAPTRSYHLGGMAQGVAASGAPARYHLVLDLDPVPEGLGVSLPRLVLATRLDLLTEYGEVCFFRHAADGTVVAGASGAAWSPGGPEAERPAGRLARLEALFLEYSDEDEAVTHPAIEPTPVSLAAPPPEQRYRAWGISDGTERLLRVGGMPIFVQHPVYPACPGCGASMMHLLSVDSGLPLEAEAANGFAELEWGSGGVANVFWCDDCRVSAWSWACS